LRTVKLLDVKFEYLGEDRDFPNARIWKVEALHVTTTRNKRKFTKDELALAGRSLSFRPLNINHDSSRQMPFPENATMAMHFNPSTMAVEGSFRVMDPAVNAMIETGRINSVSIEQIPTLGETCDEVLCEQHGVAFIGMALLESDILPGDSLTVNGIHAESLELFHKFASPREIGKSTFESIKDIIISDEQRVCKECTDFKPCEKCSHSHEFDEILEACLRQKQIDTPEMPMDLRVVQCLEELNRTNTPDATAAFKGITIQLNEQDDCMDRCLSAKKAKGDTIDDQAIAICLSECGLARPEMAHYFYKVAKERYATK